VNVSVSTLKGIPYRRAKHDFYVEPAWLVDALLDAEDFTGTVLDPACGSGTIVSACLQRGIKAIGSDIVDRGYRHTSVQDFFDRVEAVDAILCNPPYSLAVQFAKHGLRLAPKVVLLLRRVFAEGRRRRQFFADTPPIREWVTARRASLPAGIPDGQRDQHGAVIQPEGSNGSVVYSWFVWERGHRGGWLTRRLET
jgi:hypothetical protein